MKTSKTKSIHARVQEEDFDRIYAAAQQVGLEPGTLARMLLIAFSDAREQHGNQLIWPPQFNHHINADTYLDEIRKADQERLQLVAEEAGRYNQPKDQKNAHKSAG